ncbi:DUF2273 domain-containing protein [Desulfuribacillus alkaliarsenatis]|uniref:DUF2273 domain-containing protein n=1 Tax=Desulfuribacillus alkaliarsenatis TaxID=766136 RepID=A0A1E5G5H5_9FIRM|nr:DUF2273 domain-containing protein [Desulfuribacillus alkaliarsenatis]OEF98441.1 hypothetical protein BHF68_01840 [Desulfuribacillus alkaliarsenatis]
MKEEVKDFLSTNLGKVIGLTIGVVLGIIYLFFGFFKMIVFIALAAIGYFIGTKIDRNEDIRDLIERFLPNHWR